MIGTVADWRAYATARGDEAPAMSTDADALASLTRASDYIEFNYVSRFGAGYDATSPNVEVAVYEAAALELSNAGFFSKTYTPNQQKVLTKVDPIQWTAMDSGKSGADAATPVSTKIEAMLRPYMSYHMGGLVA